MEKYVEFVKNNRKKLIVLFVIINILAIIGLFQININPDFNIFMPENSKYKNTLDEMNKMFSNSEQITYLIESNDSKINLNNINRFILFRLIFESLLSIKYVICSELENILFISSRVFLYFEFSGIKILKSGFMLI